MAEFSKRASTILPDPSLISENRTCPGCGLSVVNETGGVVVAFGQSFFHVDCFKCAKCGDKVTADTNLLLLSDGSPICANCSYCCNVCKLPILDEAIMTGDDSYHAHCFKCKVCGNRIDELVFAKTSQGIYCMNCHNQRVARSRKRHQEKKAAQAQAQAQATANGTTGSNGSGRSSKAQNFNAPVSIELPHYSRKLTYQVPQHTSNSSGTYDSLRSKSSTLTSPSADLPTTPSKQPLDPSSSVNTPQHNGAFSSLRIPPRNLASPVDRSQSHDTVNSYQPAHKPSGSRPMGSPPRHRSQSSGGGLPIQDSVVPPLLQSMSLQSRSLSDSAPPSANTPSSFRSPVETVPLPEDSGRRTSRDDGVRPLQILMKDSVNASANGLNGSLQLPTSRAAKRQSINPAMAFDSSVFMESSQKRSSVTSINSNRSGSPRYASESLGRDSPFLQSPLRDVFQNDIPPSLHGPQERSATLPPILPPSIGSVDSFQQRGRAASSSHLDNSLYSRPSLRPNGTGDHLSQNGIDATAGSLSSPLDHNFPGCSNLNGRLSPLAPPNRNSSISVNSDRAPFSPTYSVNGRLSPNPGNVSPVSPTSPNHRVDVPTGIESESDRESDERVGTVDSPGTRSTPLSEDEAPPALSSKSSKTDRRPPNLNIQSPASTTTIAENELDGSEVAESEVPSGSEISHESSPVEQTSHSTFIAPALPPIRFSMSGSDFGDFMKFGGQDPQRSMHLKGAASNVPEVVEDSAEELVTPVDESGRNIPPVSTPKSDITIIKTDATPKKNGILVNSTSSSSKNGLLAEPSGPALTRSTSTRWNPKGLKTSPPRRRRASEADETPRVAAPTIFGVSHSENPMQSSTSERTSFDSDQKSVENPGLTERLDSTVSVRFVQSVSEAQKLDTARRLRTDTSDLVARRLQGALENAADRGAPHMKFDREFVEAIATMVEQRKEEYLDMKKKLDGLKRASQQYMDGLNVAQSEYDREVRARRDAEAEVTRLRVLLSGQAMRLTVLSGEAKRQDAHVQLTRELSDKMTGLERDLSTLKVERDMTLAEMEELTASKDTDDPNPDETSSKLSRNLTTRLDKIKKQYKRELLPLTQQRERLEREIDDLKAHRDLLLEETTMLNLRNEELAQLTQQYLRRVEATEVPVTPAKRENFHSSYPSKLLKWSGKASREHLAKEPAINIVPPEMTPSKPRSMKEHIFQQFSALRFARCDHCGDKMWGSHLRCTGCNINESAPNVGPLPPSMFGRDLIEQVRADAKGGERYVPVIVEKCIDAVDALALDYEGIYRKTGGSGLSKAITQLFERGDYDSFDLRDSDRFNDICSVTSVLKTYFRSLPDPLFTYALHDEFVQASHIRDPAAKSSVLSELIFRLPPEHLYTAKLLMMHLHRVSQQSEVNLMTARNLGVVFGPTLMRSQDSGAEFSDMAGKSLTVEWLVENAPAIFDPASHSSNQ
ncbi:RhoGAP-domain-containing protein [Thelephora ganbajun]|uniref:RhoGAP-domain-containing protein n=1 Tax=Thelephora ganbajun TaxID=370292 RepID=A0ACB6ZMK6_THEGA|nr:RhoGAP-domain-containing protein [Thelephora ganbajun]